MTDDCTLERLREQNEALQNGIETWRAGMTYAVFNGPGEKETYTRDELDVAIRALRQEHEALAAERDAMRDTVAVFKNAAEYGLRVLSSRQPYDKQLPRVLELALDGHYPDGRKADGTFESISFGEACPDCDGTGSKDNGQWCECSEGMHAFNAAQAEKPPSTDATQAPGQSPLSVDVGNMYGADAPGEG